MFGNIHRKTILILLATPIVCATVLCTVAHHLAEGAESQKEELVQYCLCLHDMNTGEEYGRFPYNPGDKFSITFIHSINKTPVTEGYIMCENDIVLDYCLYYSFGAGVATEVQDGEMLSHTNDNGMLISNIGRKIDPLVYFVGTISDHILNINSENYSLRDMCGKSNKVIFSLEAL